MVDVEPIVERLRQRIGLESNTYRHTVERGALIKFAKAIGETNPLYLDEDYAKTTRFGGLIAAPTWVSVYPPEVMRSIFVQDLPLSRFLHTDDIAELHDPIRPGDEITAVARYAEVYTRQGRNGHLLFQAADMTLTNQHALCVAKVRVVSVNFE